MLESSNGFCLQICNKCKRNKSLAGICKDYYWLCERCNSENQYKQTEFPFAEWIDREFESATQYVFALIKMSQKQPEFQF
jgi:hypothetical protein